MAAVRWQGGISCDLLLVIGRVTLFAGHEAARRKSVSCGEVAGDYC